LVWNSADAAADISKAHDLSCARLHNFPDTG